MRPRTAPLPSRRAIEVKILLPAKNIPAIAISTVRPEISTERPEAAAAASSAASGLLPAARSSRSRRSRA